MRRSVSIPVVALAAIGLVGCGESRQQKFEKAMRAAQVAQTALASAEDELRSREAAAEAARAEAAEADRELEAARRRHDAARETLESARAEVARWADDSSVTRELQRRLLGEAALEGAAIAARVEQGTALLDGTAPNESARERAGEIARETPGVIGVQSAITIAAPAVEAKPAPTPEPVEAIDVPIPSAEAPK